jgi:poly-gamma-glutamate capsule biosynthesis protein CapA/YwtB (metallophosphatase superfamily)
MRKVFFICLFCVLKCTFSCVLSQGLSHKTNANITLIFAGDIMGHSYQYKAAYDPKTNTFNYDVCFRGVKSLIESADYGIVNLEVPLAGPPYSGYPNFSSPDALLDALKVAGYDVILTANNHILDAGKMGLERTIHTIIDRKLLYTGSYIDKVQRDSIYPLILEKNGVRIGLLNCTFSTNNNPIIPPNKVNLLDTTEIKADILNAEAKGADILIMTVHWGKEYERDANNRQKDLVRFFSRNGVDLVIGSHPHVVQNEEHTCGNDSIYYPIYYSVGNSISNQRQAHTDGGIMVKVEIDPESKLVVNSTYIPVYIHKGVLDNVYQYHLIPTTDYLSHPERYELDDYDRRELLYFDSETRKKMNNVDILN